jgi:hypothetical protein
MGLATIFYCLRFETSLFIVSYDSQGNGGCVRRRLHTGGVLCYSGISLYSRGLDHIENTFYYCRVVLPCNCIANSLANIVIAVCLQLCCLALVMAQTTLKTPLLLSELLCNLATSYSMAHREHTSYCCMFVGMCILGRCLAMVIFVPIHVYALYCCYDASGFVFKIETASQGRKFSIIHISTSEL